MSFKKDSTDDCFYNDLKILVLNEEPIPYKLVSCYFENGEMDAYEQFYGIGHLIYSDLSAFKLQSVKQDTLLECILIFDKETFKHYLIQPIETLKKNNQIDQKFGEIGWVIKNESCLVVKSFKFDPVYLDSLQHMFSFEDAQNLTVDSLVYCFNK